MSARRDVFAEIAASRTDASSAELIIPEPLPVRDTVFPAADDPSRVVIDEPDAPHDAQSLAAALAAMRERTASFRANLAPPVAKTRRTTRLARFDWRVETEADRREIGRVFDGKGEWTEVRIPHYGEPVGRAVTWYRTGFDRPDATMDERVYLHFDAVDYRAHVFVNGYFVGSHEGFFAPFEFDITHVVRDEANVLVVKVENDYICLGNDDPPAPDGTPGRMYQGDKIYAATGLGYDDPLHGWHHCPPGMGICQPVSIEVRAAVHLADIFVRPLLDEESAEIWLDVTNTGLEDRSIVVDYSIYGRNFAETVVEGARYRPAIRERHASGDVDRGEAREVPLAMGPGMNYVRFPVEIPHPRAWSPDEPWLYELVVTLLDEEGRRLDAGECQFGMRSFLIDEESEPRGQLCLNGRPVRLRGSNTMGNFQQDVFTGDLEQLVDDLLLAKLCNMNFLRLTQRPVQREIYEYCDRVGIMTQTDLPLFGVLRRNQFSEAARQAGEMERLVRRHPCNIQVSYINEAFPNARNQPHRHLQRHELDAWIEAANRTVLLQNPDRMIKPHDGDYDPPEPGLPDHHCYNGWYNGHGLGIGKLHRGYWQQVKRGWHYACGEFGSEGLDPVPLMRRRYPSSWLPKSPEEEKRWSPNSIIKSQTGRYHYMWFDTQSSLEDWVRESHRHQAFVTSLMTEAFRRDSRMVSYAIHLFIDAFPSGWMKAIMDVERNPKPAYFAFRDACAPLLASLRTDRWAVSSGEQVELEAWVCSDLPLETDAVLAWTAELDGTRLSAGTTRVTVPACSSRCAGLVRLPAPDVARRGTLTVRLALSAPADAGRPVSVTSQEIALFPADEQTPGTSGAGDVAAKIAILGRTDGPASRLLGELGVHAAPSADASVLVLDSVEAYREEQEAIDAAVRAGATVVMLGLEPGSHTIAGTQVEIERTGMREFFFVSRKTGHPLVDGFAERDFAFWYDPAHDYISPILGTVMRAGPQWATVLGSGVVSWGAEGGPAAAALEREVGKGKIRICQVELAGRTVNPAARAFARRLLS